MGWVIAVIVIAIVGMCMDSDLGKIALAAGALALGCWLLEWILDLAFFGILAKICVAAVVLIVLFAILASIFG